jgi:DNA-binding CsgD family transcriptional regulator
MGEAVADLFTRLDREALEVIDIAVVIGDPLDVGLVAAVSGRDLGAVLDALEHAEAIGIVRDGDRPGTFVFTHDVFRSGRYGSLPAGRRMRVHAAVAAALDRSDLDECLLPTVARHAGLAGGRFDLSRAAELCRRAGDAAMRAADHSAAAAHYRRALDSMALDPSIDEGVRLALTIDLGASLLLSGEGGGDLILRDAVHDARRRGDPVTVAAALVAMAQVPGGQSAVLLGQEFEAIFAETIDELPSSETVWRIRLIGNLGTHLYFADDVERAMPLLEDALDAARRTGDPVTIGRALMAYRWGGGPFAMGQRIACGHELIALGERTGQDVFSIVGCQQLAWCHRQLGDRAALTRWHAAAARLVRGPDLEQLSIDLSIAVLDGDLDRADQITADVVGVQGLDRVYADGCTICVDDTRGRLLGRKVVEDAIADAPVSRWHLEPFLARTLVRSGQADRAGRLLVESRARGYGPPASNRWTMVMSCLAETAALCGDVDVAADVADLLAPLAGRWIDNGLIVWDTVDRARALCLLTVGDAPTAAELARAAAETSKQQATPILRARELIVAARADAVLGRPPDEALWREALGIAHWTGARLIERDVRLLLPSAAVHDETGLTLREREIIDHVARGDTNRQIASALRVSEATVRKHLEGAFRKLGVSTRTAAVARLRGEH